MTTNESGKIDKMGVREAKVGDSVSRSSIAEKGGIWRTKRLFGAGRGRPAGGGSGGGEGKEERGGWECKGGREKKSPSGRRWQSNRSDRQINSSARRTCSRRRIRRHYPACAVTTELAHHVSCADF